MNAVQINDRIGDVSHVDKRVLKTKTALRDALLDLIREKDFENIKTKEICERAMVSRNTFYNYFSDKYALLEYCFEDYEERFGEHFDEKQKLNNPDHDEEQGFVNLADTFLDMEEEYRPIAILSSFDLMSLYYREMMRILTAYENRELHSEHSGYDLTQLNSFLILGFWGFIHGNAKRDRKKTRKDTEQLVRDC